MSSYLNLVESPGGRALSYGLYLEAAASAIVFITFLKLIPKKTPTRIVIGRVVFIYRSEECTGMRVVKRMFPV